MSWTGSGFRWVGPEPPYPNSYWLPPLPPSPPPPGRKPPFPAVTVCVVLIPTLSLSGLSSLSDKYKHPSAVGQPNKTLNNFLKAPPPPRNKSVKQANSANGVRPLESAMDSSNGVLHNFTVTQNKKTFLDANAGKSNLVRPSSYLQPDASSQAITDMGHIVASIDANVSEKPMNLVGASLNGSSALSSDMNLNSNVSLDSGLNLCSNLGLNAQGAVVGAPRTQFLASSAPPMFTSVSGAQLSGNTAIAGQVKQNVKGILPASLLGKASVGATPLTSSAVYKGKQVSFLLWLVHWDLRLVLVQLRCLPYNTTLSCHSQFFLFLLFLYIRFRGIAL